jgi:hypothetical protein
MKTYRGIPVRDDQGSFIVKVYTNRVRQGQPVRILDIAPSQALWNHSDGFAWGYCGSGPAQLALALLLDATGNKDLAVDVHQAFKAEVVAGFEIGRTWTYSEDQVLAWVELRCRENHLLEVKADG